ncbi:hypothetical protein DFH27DRAFT_488263, partial [Peziza echinospora]
MQQQASHFKRSYQACLACRSRKVRCDLGNPDAPSAPPCARCRREGKECMFGGPRASTKKKEKDKDDQEDRDDHDDNHDDDGNDGDDGAPPRKRSKSGSGGSSEDILVTARVHSTHDALDLLFQAAERLGRNSPSRMQTESDEEVGEEEEKLRKESQETIMAESRRGSITPMPSPTILRTPGSVSGAETIAVALKAWSRFKYVSLNWLTALEAFQYINYFHAHLHPLSPILSPHFSLPSSQLDLISHEPILAMTILTIAARYCPLEGEKRRRGLCLHDVFWRITQDFVGRLGWGIDRGGGSKRRGKEMTGPRGLGTAEALLLWTEWHSRGLHFPPSRDGLCAVKMEREEEEGGVSGRSRWLEEVIQPTTRSDQLCWMVLGTALTLTHELGIFDTLPDESPAAITKLTTNTSSTSAHDPSEPPPYRAARLRKLCYIYLLSLSTRLNWSSPLDHNSTLLSIVRKNITETAGFSRKWHKIMSLYLSLTLIVKTATDKLFLTKTRTREVVRSGEYVFLVQDLGRTLASWENNLSGLAAGAGAGGGGIIPRLFWNVMRIEYCYVRIFVYSISLEAVCGEDDDYDDDEEEELAKVAGQEQNDWEFIQRAFSSGLEMLEIVITITTIPWLRFAPVRIYVRVIFAAIFLLKATALMLSSSKTCLQTLGQTIEALRSCAVDEVHLANRFSELLGMHIEGLLGRVVAWEVAQKRDG